MDRLLTDEEFVEAQENYIKKARKEKGIVLACPNLLGWRRDECNREAQDAKTLKAVGKDYYCIPRWCRLFPLWGISCCHVVEQGEDYCKTCEYYRGEMPRAEGQP